MSHDMAHAPMPGAEDLAEPMRSRWSPSVFDADHRFSARDIEVLLHAAQWAPSGGNQQPWRFIVAERGSEQHDAVVRHLSRGNSDWVPRASVVFLTATQVDADDESEAPREVSLGYYALGQAAAHLTLQAQAAGWWAHQFAGFDRDAVATELGFPESSRIAAGIAVGVRGDASQVDVRDQEREERPRVRRALTEIAFGERWGVPWSGVDVDAPDTLTK